MYFICDSQYYYLMNNYKNVTPRYLDVTLIKSLKSSESDFSSFILEDGNQWKLIELLEQEMIDARS